MENPTNENETTTEDLTDTETLEAGEQETEDGEEGDGEGVQMVADTEAKAAKAEVDKAKAYETFMAALNSHAAAIGLATKEQKGFYQFLNAGTGHKLYVAKQSKGVTRIDTTLPASELPGISLPLDKPNGRIACHVQPSVDAVTMALDVLASYGSKIRAPERKAKAETPSTK